MNVDLLIGCAAVLVAALTLAWQMRKDSRTDRRRQEQSLVDRERRRAEYETKVDELARGHTDHETRIRRLERRDDDA